MSMPLSHNSTSVIAGDERRAIDAVFDGFCRHAIYLTKLTDGRLRSKRSSACRALRCSARFRKLSIENCRNHALNHQHPHWRVNTDVLPVQVNDYVQSAVRIPLEDLLQFNPSLFTCRHCYAPFATAARCQCSNISIESPSFNTQYFTNLQAI